MRKIIFLCFIASVFATCKNNSKSTTNDSLRNSLATKKQTDSLIKKFKPIIQGVWVKADYINKLIKTKSPLAASDLAAGLTTIYINTGDIHGDSIVSMAGYDNHDGANATIKFQAGKNQSTIIFNGRDLGYAIENGDTVLIFSQYDNKKERFFKVKYIRVLKKQPEGDLGYGMHIYVNKAIVAGNYTLSDSTGVISNVYFSEDGKVNGFLNWKTHMINIDLNSDVNDNLDAIYFKNSNKENGNYSFKIIADTLSLYNTYENSDSTELLLGKLKYKLVRQR
jgi:hypothetical protein